MMEIDLLTPERYKEWDDFCLASDDAWFWHTSDWLHYTLNYKPEYKPRPLSFFVKNQGKMLAVAPLIAEEKNGVKEFSYGGDWGPMPALANGLSVSDSRKTLKVVFEEINKKAKEEKVKLAKFRFSVLNKSFIETRAQSFNHPMKFGYLGHILNTQVLDLSFSLEDLKRGLRHGHKADISRAKKFLEAEVYDSENITKDVFEKYIEMHHKAAGRETRPRLTFDMMHDWIKNGHAFLVGAKKDNFPIAFSYFFRYKDNVYYGSSCVDPDAQKLPAGHLIQWAAIEYMRKNNFKFYELGWQQYGPILFDFPSEKEIRISAFKRGFGGKTYPLFIAEKYYDKDYFLKNYENRIKRFFDLTEK